MMKFDHLRIHVTDLVRSRAWYVTTLGLKVEFEVPDRQTAGYGAELQDPDGYLIRLWDERSMKENSHLVVAFRHG